MQAPPTTVTTPPPSPPGPTAGGAEGQEAATAAHPRGPRGAGGRVDGLRDDDGGRERPPPAREPRRVRPCGELDRVLRRRQGAAGAADRQREPHLARRRSDLAEHRERGDCDRGPPLLRA